MEIITLPFFISFSLTLICGFIISPILATLIPAHKMEKVGRKKRYLYSLLASSIHATTAFSFATYILLTSSSLSSDKPYSTDRQGLILFQIIIGYISSDLLLCVTDSYLRTDYLILFHHVAMITGISMCMYSRCFMFFVVYRATSEFSTPFVNLRMVLYEIGDKKGWMYYISSFAMMISFFAARVVLIPWYTYTLFVSLFNSGGSITTSLKLYMVVNSIFFDVLNIYWGYRIIKGGYKFICGKKKE